MNELIDTEPILSWKNQVTIFLIYLSIFINSIVLFNEPFEFYLGYLIFVGLLPVFMSRHKFNAALIVIFVILFATGIFNIAIGNNTAPLFFKVFSGLALSYLFYYYVIVEFKFDVVKLFNWYLKGCYIAALIGLIQFLSFLVSFSPGYDYSWLLNKWAVIRGGNFGIRINSIFAEPTYLASTLSASFFVSLRNIFTKETFGLSRIQSLVIVFVYLMSFSGLGQGAIFVSIVLLFINYGLFRYILVAIPVFVIMFNVLYNNVSEFKERYDGLIGLFSGEKFVLGKTHGSSFILYNNYHVAFNNFSNNYVLGSGIGSHPVAFEKYSLAKGFKVSGFNSNSADANSMLLRLISETGIFGVGLILVIIFKGYVSRNTQNASVHWIVSNSILVMILLNLFRQGHYFLNGFPFFVLLYIYNKLSYLSLVETGKDLHEHTVEEELEMNGQQQSLSSAE